jgi:CubicO group peptidase (beta-lactamase class C family)
MMRFDAYRLVGALVLLGLMLAPLTVRAQRASDHVTEEKVEAAWIQLEALITEEMQKTGVPGIAIGIVYRDKPIYLKGYGVRDVGTSYPVDADTVFQLASLSKPLGSTVIAGLVSDGVVKWDDPIIKYDPGFEMDNPYLTRNVTIRDMYSHRSGLHDHAGDLLEDMGYDRAGVLYRLRFVPTGNRFRSQYAYTNFGVTEGGVAAAKAAGKTWEEISEERLYKPLRMISTSSRLSDFLAQPNRARGHVLIDGKWQAKYQREPDAQSPAGGASSSARDMAQWMRLHLGGGKVDGKQIIAADALAETYRPQMVSNPARDPATDRTGFYGLGWGVSYDELGRVKLSHSGAFDLGAATTVYLLPSEQLGIVILTNAAPIGVAEALAQSFLDLATYGELKRDWVKLYKQGFAALTTAGRSPIDYSKAPAQPVPGLANDGYVGAYHNDFFGEVEIVAKDGELVMQQGPRKTPFSLKHYNRNVFFYETAGENEVGLTGVTFTIGTDGKATTMTVENLNGEGLGTFTRVPDEK